MLIPMKQYPDETWLFRVQRNNIVFLVKENRFAEIEWPYEAPGPGHVCGMIGLRFFHGEQWEGRRYSHCDTWFIRPNGQGINGSQCIMPVMGHVPDEEPEHSPEDIKYILRRLNRLEEIVLYGGQRKHSVIIDMPMSTDMIRRTNKGN